MAIFPFHALWDAGTAARVAGAAHDRASFSDQLADDDVVALSTVLRETLGRVDFAVAGWRGGGGGGGSARIWPRVVRIPAR